VRTARIRPDLLGPECPEGLEIVQITTGELPSTHIYMEAQIFTPDSKRFLLHESATPHGSDPKDPNHRYLLCDLEQGCKLSPVTQETGATAPSVSPDGMHVYYFVDETRLDGGKLTLKRMNLDGSAREVLYVLQGTVPGTPFFPSQIYPLSTIRSDGKSLALSCFLADMGSGRRTWGLMVFDLESPSVTLILEGPSWCNVHPQYSRSIHPGSQRDILVQENHGNTHTPEGEIIDLTGGNGADVHVIRDDGSSFRNMPWGRDGNEFCQGHQCWRGNTAWAITSTDTRHPDEQQLIESVCVPHTGHDGARSPGAIRNNLSREFPSPSFSHFATDASGSWFVTDTFACDNGGRVFVARMGNAGTDPLSSWTCIAYPRCSWRKDAHIHPFLSPDGKTAFFNSDESGVLQAYMVRGLESLGI